MLHPYRKSPRAHADDCAEAARWDDRALALVMLTIGVPRAALALATHERFGAEATAAAVCALLAVLLLASASARRSA